MSSDDPPRDQLTQVADPQYWRGPNGSFSRMPIPPSAYRTSGGRQICALHGCGAPLGAGLGEVSTVDQTMRDAPVEYRCCCLVHAGAVAGQLRVAALREERPMPDIVFR
jgi:hypothetical protein